MKTKVNYFRLITRTIKIMLYLFFYLNSLAMVYWGVFFSSLPPGEEMEGMLDEVFKFCGHALIIAGVLLFGITFMVYYRARRKKFSINKTVKKLENCAIT